MCGTLVCDPYPTISLEEKGFRHSGCPQYVLILLGAVGDPGVIVAGGEIAKGPHAVSDVVELLLTSHLQIRCKSSNPCVCAKDKV